MEGLNDEVRRTVALDEPTDQLDTQARELYRKAEEIRAQHQISASVSVSKIVEAAQSPSVRDAARKVKGIQGVSTVFEATAGGERNAEPERLVWASSGNPLSSSNRCSQLFVGALSFAKTGLRSLFVRKQKAVTDAQLAQFASLWGFTCGSRSSRKLRLRVLAKRFWSGSHFENGVIYSRLELLLLVGLKEVLRRRFRRTLRWCGLSKKPDRNVGDQNSVRLGARAVPASGQPLDNQQGTSKYTARQASLPQ